MASGDGLIIRVRPRVGRLTAAEVAGLCEAAKRHGNGVLELTSRANLQIRGVSENGLAALIAELGRLGLLDPDAETEARRNVIVAPLWHDEDDTHSAAQTLTDRLADLPPLPAKFGFAVDAGPRRLLSQASADIRIERRAGGGLIVRADGAPGGWLTSDPVDAALRMARWFAGTRGDARRMRDVQNSLPAEWAAEPPTSATPLQPGASEHGPVVGVPFGQMDAAAFAAIVATSGAAAVRLAPERLMLLESGTSAEGPFVTAPGDPLLAADACPGAPACAAATVETRVLAVALAARVPGLHVSGCAKGCARAHPSRVTFVGRDGRFDLVRDGAAWDTPVRRGMTPAEVLEQADTF